MKIKIQTRGGHDAVSEIQGVLVASGCALGCGEEIWYRVHVAWNGASPDVSAVDGYTRYGAGHLCGACSDKIRKLRRDA